MKFAIVGAIRSAQTIAAGRGIRERRRLDRLYGSTFWRKMKGIATVRWSDGRLQVVELHRYEGHGVGRREPKIKRALDEPRG